MARFAEKKETMTREGSHIDSRVDRELRNRFSDTEQTEAGLCSHLGAQLERLRYGLGPSEGGGVPNDVPRGISFRSGWSESVMVESALFRLMEPPRARPNMSEERRSLECIAASQAVVVLREYYRPRPPNALLALQPLEPFAAVACIPGLVVERDRVPAIGKATLVTRDWLKARCAAELEVYGRAKKLSAEQTADRRARRAQMLAEAAAKRAGQNPLQRYHAERLEAVFAQADRLAQNLDVEGEIKRRWDREPMHEDMVCALQALCALAAPGPGAKADGRKQARDALATILSETRNRWDLERGRYGAARREIDAERKRAAEERRKRAVEAFEAEIDGRGS